MQISSVGDGARVGDVLGGFLRQCYIFYRGPSLIVSRKKRAYRACHFRHCATFSRKFFVFFKFSVESVFPVLEVTSLVVIGPMRKMGILSKTENTYGFYRHSATFSETFSFGQK